MACQDESEIFYQMSEFYAPEQACGLRWNDPLLQIAWPLVPQILSEKDQAYPDAQLSDFGVLQGLV